MILNLSKKTIISSNPRYVIIRGFGLGFLLRSSFGRNDSIVLQNCRVLFRLFGATDAEALHVNFDNSIGKVSSCGKKLFLRVGEGSTIVLLPKGNIALSDTRLGDIINLNAELTTAQKKSFLKASKLVVPVPGAVISKADSGN